MAKRKTTIRYIDTHTGRAHKFDAEVEAGATRKQVTASLAKLFGMPASRIRITGGV